MQLRPYAKGTAFQLLRWLLRDSRPVIVGGTGGSGTRAVQAVLTRAGAFMGVRLNRAGDAMDFEPFLDDMINRVLVITRSLDYELRDLPTALQQELFDGLDRTVERFRSDGPIGARWGWKNPRSMYLLPVIYRRFPGMSFVHVVRDGRDMALSENRNQLQKHYEALFGEPAINSDNSAALRMWAETNMAVAHWAERTLHARYIRIRFEDLCSDAIAVCAALARVLELPIVDGELLASSITNPSSLGRWRGGNSAIIMHPRAQLALETFGYAEAAPPRPRVHAEI
jgi:hypothetical protein